MYKHKSLNTNVCILTCSLLRDQHKQTSPQLISVSIVHWPMQKSPKKFPSVLRLSEHETRSKTVPRETNASCPSSPTAGSSEASSLLPQRSLHTDNRSRRRSWPPTWPETSPGLDPSRRLCMSCTARTYHRIWNCYEKQVRATQHTWAYLWSFPGF